MVYLTVKGRTRWIFAKQAEYIFILGIFIPACLFCAERYFNKKAAGSKACGFFVFGCWLLNDTCKRRKP